MSVPPQCHVQFYPIEPLLCIRSDPNSFVKQEANARLRARVDAGALRVLSFGEGAPSRVTALLPKLIVVPPDSAYPGFGDFQPLPGLDHIQAHRRLSYPALSPLGNSGRCMFESPALLRVSLSAWQSHGMSANA